MDIIASIQEIVAVDNINDWQNDSLYIYDDDMNTFYEEYNNIFDCGTYNNLESGKFDPYGINYYKADSIEKIIVKIQKNKPANYTTLLSWLTKAKTYNGFYILGV